MKKKGLAEVIAVTLLILITIVIGVSINSFFTGFIKNQKNEFSFNPYLKASIDDVKIERGVLATASPSAIDEERIILTVTRLDNEGEDISGIRFIFSKNSGENKMYDIKDKLESAVSKSYEISNSDIGITSFSEIEKVSLSFLLPNGKPTQILSEKELENLNN